MYKTQGKAKTALNVLKFFDWCYRHGAHSALQMHYVPLPEKVIKMVEKSWKNTIKDSSGNAIYK